MANDQRADVLHILLFESAFDYATRLADELRASDMPVAFVPVQTFDMFAATLPTQAWDAVIVAFPVSSEALQIIPMTDAAYPLYILCEDQDENQAFDNIAPAIADILSVSRLKRFPFMLRRDLTLRTQGDHTHNIDSLPQQKQMEDSLYNSDSRFRAMIEGFNDIILIADTYQIIRYTNPALLTMLGFRAAGVIGKPYATLLHPDEAATVTKQIDSLMRQSYFISTLEHQMRHADGSWRIVETNGHRMNNPIGQPMLILHIRDITERKLAQRELEALYGAISPLLKADNLRQLGMQIVETATRELEHVDCGLMLVDANRNEIIRLARTGKYNVQPELPLLRNGIGLVPEAIRTGEMLYVPDVTRDHRYLPSDQRTRSELVIPLKGTTGVIGALDLQRSELDAFSERDQRLLSAFAERAATAIENRMLYEEINAHAADLTERITERTLALQATKDRVEAILNNSLDGILLVKSDLHIQQSNRAAATLLKYDFGNHLDTTLLDFVHPEDVPRVESLVQAVLTSGQGNSIEIRAHAHDGTAFDMELTIGRLEHNGLLCTIRDITTRKQIQVAVAEERNLLRTLIDAIPDYIYVKDIQHRTVISNLARARSFGMTPEETVGKDDFAFVPVEMVNQFHADEDRLFETSQPLIDHEERTIGQDGSVIWASTTKVPLRNLSGDLIGLAGITRDITERKLAEERLRESEEKYRRLIETMHGGVAMYDVHENVTYTNERFCEMVGYTREELIGMSAYKFIDPTNIDLAKAQSALRKLGQSSSYELMFRRKDGQPLYLVVSGAPLFDKDGTHAGSFAVATDITTQKYAEAALRQALERERELGELKSRFVSMTSHEFRTPLATILATTDSLSAYRHKMTDEQIDMRLARIQEQIGHLKNIMDDVLNLARLQARRAEFNPQSLDLDALCRTVIDEFESQPSINHQFAYVAAHAPLKANLDAKLMRQILVNLLSNAVKYSPENSTATVKLDEVNNEIHLSVHDNGIGIPQADIARLFEPFHRASNVGTIQGTGLGLVIAKESVELHNGTIAVESQVGAGTTITIRIPTIHVEP